MEDEEYWSTLQDVCLYTQLYVLWNRWGKEVRQILGLKLSVNDIVGFFVFSLQSKPPPPPPTGFPKVPQTAPTGPGGPPSAPVNMFSRRAGNRQHSCLKYGTWNYGSMEEEKLQVFLLPKMWRQKSWLFWSCLGTVVNSAISWSCGCCWPCLCLASALWLLPQLYRDLGVIVCIPGALFSDSERWLNLQTV